MFIDPKTDVYKDMIIGVHQRPGACVHTPQQPCVCMHAWLYAIAAIYLPILGWPQSLPNHLHQMITVTNICE